MFSANPKFDKLLDKATSNLRLEPDWHTIIHICDLIRQGDVQPKYVLAAIKKKLISTNPHVALFALQVLESTVKNCGSLIQEEVGKKSYMEQLREIVKTTQHESVRNKVLEMLQAWAYAFRNTPKYRAVQDTVILMKTEGYKFPTLKESDAMFMADTAPEWADGQCCHRCRVQFSMMQRKHHCRACGQIFCNQCTSKSCTLPKFGIEKEVRVCETCYEKFSKPSTSASSSPASSRSEELPVEYLRSPLSQQSQVAPPPRKTEEELREEEELQLALALSQSEAESKKPGSHSNSISIKNNSSYSPPPQLSSSPVEDPELARYLDRGYWQNRQSESSIINNAPSAPIYASVNKETVAAVAPVPSGPEEMEMDSFVERLRAQLEIFVNRMKSNSSRGRSVANDSSVQTLFMNITDMHSQLLKYVKKQDDKRVYYEGLQDKLTQVRDARAALDALREERREQLRREAEQAERVRQIQMAQKLDIMRKKKQEYLQYQRQVALHRIQEQEREMQMRQEQQKQMNLRGPPPFPQYYTQGYDGGVPVGPYGMPPPPQMYQPPPPFHGGPPMMGPEYMMPGAPGAGVPYSPGVPMGPVVPTPMADHHLVSPMNQPPVIPGQPQAAMVPPNVPPAGVMGPPGQVPPGSMVPPGGMPPAGAMLPPGQAPVRMIPPSNQAPPPGSMLPMNQGPSGPAVLPGAPGQGPPGPAMMPPQAQGPPPMMPPQGQGPPQGPAMMPQPGQQPMIPPQGQIPPQNQPFPQQEPPPSDQSVELISFDN